MLCDRDVEAPTCGPALWTRRPVAGRGARHVFERSPAQVATDTSCLGHERIILPPGVGRLGERRGPARMPSLPSVGGPSRGCARLLRADPQGSPDCPGRKGRPGPRRFAVLSLFSATVTTPQVHPLQLAPNIPHALSPILDVLEGCRRIELRERIRLGQRLRCRPALVGRPRT